MTSLPYYLIMFTLPSLYVAQVTVTINGELPVDESPTTQRNIDKAKAAAYDDVQARKAPLGNHIYSKQSQNVNHQNSTDHMPYKCVACNRRFRRLCALLNHRRMELRKFELIWGDWCEFEDRQRL
ncbi:unnamed protein product [Litomosoides sigmodontis]|uniref:C2H2-type domain-containing protein n=1 Tax=Litomosoides sigmodontis TaxID=42156 RepID=A0A3P6U6Y0_LITSI|nr:unnamed protein product [Litomosoides sigmodontis]